MDAPDPNPHAPPAMPTDGILVDRELQAALGHWILPAPGATPPPAAHVQPTSLDLRLGAVAHRIRAGFTPERGSFEERLSELRSDTVSLADGGAVLDTGAVYLIPLDEELALPAGVRARFHPRSSTGRSDIFARVLCPGHSRFDEAPEGYQGPLWLEVAPLSFPVRLCRGDRLAQVRLSAGRSALTTEELREIYSRTPLVFDGERPLGDDEVLFDEEGGLSLRVGLTGRDPAGWRARRSAPVLSFGKEGANEAAEFWEAVPATEDRAILVPGEFYLLASRERLRVPPDLAAEMLPVDVGIGELRNNYAGFFDAGFGWREGRDGQPQGCGTPAVLEVRAHDVPFLVEDGQVLFRLRWFRATGRPVRIYGEGRQGRSYADQDLTLARAFRSSDT